MPASATLSNRLLVTDHSLGPTFWDEYAVLWHNSRDKSPFQSPEILKYFSGKFANAVVAIRQVIDQRLTGVVILKKENGIYSFLSDLKTDANYFVFHRECTGEDMEVYFTGLFDLIKKQGWAVIFNSMPSSAEYMQAFEKCGANKSLFFQSIDYSVCPLVIADNPEEIRSLLYRSERVRVKANRLKNRLHAEFEVLLDDEDLENWAQEFCNAHILRWGNTSTPSKFQNPDRRLFLLNCLMAWNENKVLVRFATKLNGQRIGLIIGLVTGNSVVTHSLTYHPEHHRASPVLALLLTVADFMIGKKLNILDFGNGNETYKYYFSNKELVLKRIFISGKANYLFVARAKLIKFIKNYPAIYSFYQKNIKRFLNQGRDAKIKAGDT